MILLGSRVVHRTSAAAPSDGKPASAGMRFQAAPAACTVRHRKQRSVRMQAYQVSLKPPFDSICWLSTLLHTTLQRQPSGGRCAEDVSRMNSRARLLELISMRRQGAYDRKALNAAADQL